MTLEELLAKRLAESKVLDGPTVTEIQRYDRFAVWDFYATGLVGNPLDMWLIGGELPFMSFTKAEKEIWVDGVASWCFLLSIFYDRAKKGKILKSFGLKDPYTGEPYSPTRDEAKREQVYVDYVCDEILVHYMGEIQNLKTLVRLYSPEDRIKWLGAERAREIQLELGLSEDE
jgi:hypothetical protein